MKKDTVTTFLDKLEGQAKREKDEPLRGAKLNAVQQCRRWLNLTWADMLTPVSTKLNALTTEAKPLLEKENELSFSEEDATCLQRARAVYTIYYQFYQKIYPTAHRANVSQSIRKPEKKESISHRL